MQLVVDHNQQVYLSYKSNDSSHVFQYNGTAWNDITPTGGNVNPYTSIAIDNNNNLYFAYTANNGTPGYVQKYSNGSWTTVGGGAFNTTGCPGLSIATTPSGNPVVFYSDFDINSSNLLHGTAQEFNGTSWNIVGTRQFTTNAITEGFVAVDINNHIFVCFTEENESGSLTDALSVYTFGGSANAIKTVSDISNLQVYPNPSNGNFIVNIDTKVATGIQLSVYDILGQLALQQTPTQSNGTVSIPVNMQHAASGIYTLEIKTNSGVENRLIEVK